MTLFRTAIGCVVLAACGSSPPPATTPPPLLVPLQPATVPAPPPSSAPSSPASEPSPLDVQGLPETSPECPRCPSPAPGYPTEHCADGLHLGGRGPCVHFANGQCGWSHLVCPAASATTTCAKTDCSLPVPAEWICPDRKTRGYFACVPDANGRCGATYHPCRPAPPAPAPAPAPPPRAGPPQTPHPCAPLPSDRELATWPVHERCGPGSGPAPPPQTTVKSLGDGTEIIESLGRCLRVRYKRCRTKCLPPDARIATPAGDVAIRDLRVGSEVWTEDARGRRVVDRVAETATTTVDGEHHVARLALADGRTLIVSPEHPLRNGRRVQDLRAGDVYDGSRLVTLELVRFTGPRTHDIRLEGGGLYWADGIPVESTLGYGNATRW